ncbi:PLP-dependent aminotransferase family protein [Rhodanobacter aciditrophus]|uniref:PLP-dependent aminotransferase family protein n=1 Tax=Rhodanobacter aciditrophus TaxID=1623218 RepID=A0ABW4B8W0_9GAMM
MKLSTPVLRMKSSFIREILAAASDPNVISLAGGLPDEKTFPLDILKPVMTKIPEDVSLFQYGPTQGYGPLVKHLTARYEVPNHHKLLVTTGSQQGLDLIARAFFDPEDKIVMEAPSYLGAMQVFDLVQARILEVPQTDEGPDLEALEVCFATQRPKAFYGVPDFHNPTGVSWSLATRHKVAELCLAYQVTLIEDAPYRDLRFSGDALPMVSSFCPDQSLVLRSFSKIASPGLRMGVVSGPEAWVDALIKVKQGADLHSSVPVQAMLLGLLEHPDFDAHVAKVSDLYQGRYQVLAKALSALEDYGCRTLPTQGGMFVWLTLPDCDTMALAYRLLDQGIAAVPSDVFYSGDKGQSALRLNFTNATPDKLEQAVMRLESVLKSLAPKAAVGGE